MKGMARLQPDLHTSPKYPASEANGSVDLFNALDDRVKQNLLNFLRSL